MLTSKSLVIYNAILRNWFQGNFEDANRAIRRLTKIQLVELLIRPYECEEGRSFIGDTESEYDFQRFIETSLTITKVS